MSYFNKKNIVDQWGPIDARVLYPSFWFKPTAMVSHGINWPHLIGEYNHNRLTFYWEQELMEKHGKKAIEKWILPNNKRQIIWREYQSIIKKLENDKLVLEKLDIKSKKELKKISTNWYNHLISFWRLSLIYEIANFAAPEYLANHLKKNQVDSKNIDEIVEILLTPEKLSFHQKSEYELLKIYLTKKEKQNYLLKIHEQKWNWIDSSYFEIDFVGFQDWKKRMNSYSYKKAIVLYKKLKNYRQSVYKNKKNIIKKYNLPKEYFSIAEALSFSIWWQDQRKMRSWWAYAGFDKILQTLSKFYNIDKKDLLYYTAEEWLKLAAAGVLVEKKVIQQRKGYFIFILKKINYKLLYSEKAKNFIKPIISQIQDQQKNDKIIGVVAFRSKENIIGKVKVVMSPRLVKKIKKDEILVAPMTSPDYIHLMRQAKAIVTDIGGLMSHAAVVARELGKTCIIGTKVATQQLKDGDIIKIDTKSGLIIIK
ncbi:MAG: PEP-utilizing enzyme [Candidatus Margulisiibacteriota bacterium]|jgi:phosphohistidine swiveling domain-containing protein